MSLALLSLLACGGSCGAQSQQLAAPAEETASGSLSEEAAEANAMRQTPVALWSNRMRPAWRALDYALRKEGKGELSEAALEQADQLRGLAWEPEPDLESLAEQQRETLSSYQELLRDSSGEIREALDLLESRLGELRAMIEQEQVQE